VRISPVRLAAAVIVGVVLWNLPVPDGLSVQAWQMFAIFIGTLSAVIANAMPLGAIAVLGIAVTAITQVLSDAGPEDAIARALSGFSETVVWLIVAAFLIAKGFIKSGLGARIAYLFVRMFGKTTLGLAYAMIGADLLLAPAIPSNTARGGGVIYPIVRSLVEAFKSRPEDGTERRIGSFLLFSSFHGNIITSALFLTAMAANPMAVQFAGDQGVDIGFGRWLLAASVPALAAFFLVPLYLYKAYPPEVKKTPEAAEWARGKLADMGPVQFAEWIMLGTFVLLLALWIGGDHFGIHPTTTAFIGLSILIVTGVLGWDDVVREKGAWDVFVWFSVLLMMARSLGEFGFTTWLGHELAGHMGDLSWPVAYVALVVMYSLVHYLFASQTAQIAALYPAFLSVGIMLGVPPVLLALALGFAGNYYATTTIYGGSVAPVFFQAGYIPLGTWMKHGIVILGIHLVLFLGLGTAWMKIVGVF
jgi:DASS family divalent anion:Na+ symporter